MAFSYSKVECYHSCPYLYKLRYLDKLKVKPDQSPQNALYMGTAVHEGIETGSIDKAIESYKSNYTEITNDHELAIAKVTEAVKKGLDQLPRGVYELKLNHEDGFVGYIDCIVEVDENTVDIYDFKFSNNVAKYEKSSQIHVYKYYYENLTGKKVRDIYYACLPKSDKNTIEEVIEDMKTRDVVLKKIEYNKQHVNFFFARKSMMFSAVDFPKKKNRFCKWCDYYKYCSSNCSDRSELLDDAEVNQEPNNSISEISLF